MKKIFVLFTFLSLASFAVNAQTCPHAKKSTSTASTEVSSDYAKTVAAAAAMDENIEQKVCAKSGKVSYERKSVCASSGKVSYTAVEYDAATKKFVNVSPSAAKDKKSCCSASCAKSCSKSKSASTSAKSDAKVKVVKNEQ